MRIIPAIDIINGKCVRLTKGNYNTVTVYNEDPLEVARKFEDHGMEYLHLVDLDGAKAEGIIHYRILEKIATRTNLKIDFGGGIKSDTDLRIAFECGAQQITAGSIAIKAPEVFKNWIAQYGPEKIILGADVKEEKIAVSGWLEESTQTVIPFLQEYRQSGISYVTCTDISRDGMLEGPAVELYQKIIASVPGIRLIASGGVSGYDDLIRLNTLGCEGVIIGKAIYENRITLRQLEQFNL